MDRETVKLKRGKKKSYLKCFGDLFSVIFGLGRRDRLEDFLFQDLFHRTLTSSFFLFVVFRNLFPPPNI